jgi:hypothetical protein
MNRWRLLSDAQALLPDRMSCHAVAVGRQDVLLWGRPCEGSLALMRTILSGRPLACF